MRSSFSIQIGAVLALLCANSQALPILDHATNLIPKTSIQPAVHNHVERDQNGDNVISLYGFYRRQLDPELNPRNSPDQFSHHNANSQPEKSISNDPNTPPIPLEAADTAATFASTTAIISASIPTPTQAPVSQGHSEIRSSSRDFGPGLPIPISIPSPQTASSQGTSTFPAGLSSVHYLYAAEWNEHQPNVWPGQSTKHDGHRGDSLFRTVPMFDSKHGVNGWQSSSPLKSFFAHPGGILKDILNFINPQSAVFTIRTHRVRPAPPTRTHGHEMVHPVQPQPFGNKNRFMNFPFRKPGAEPAGRIYQPSPSLVHIPLVGPGGTIHMASPSLTNSQPLPIHFTISPQTCAPLAMECECMARDLASRLTNSYPLGVPASTNSVTETVAMKMNGFEYRATLDLKLDKKIDGQGFRDLVGLLFSAKKELAQASHGRGFGTVRMLGNWLGVGVEAHWTYYTFEHGVARRCS